MPLPELIEIVPLTKPVRAEITVPGSKSITNRALILAALADGETTLQGALWSEDTQIMVDCLQKLGFSVTLQPDLEEFCNRIITVKGLGGKIPNAGTAHQPLELFVGNAGTAARFLAALVCLGDGVYRLHGVPRMHERPQAALLNALRELGYRVESENGNDKLPARIFGEAPLSGSRRGNEAHSEEKSQSLLTSALTSERRRTCIVSIKESSQFASALLLCAKVGGWEVRVVGENAEESPYVAMTSKMIEVSTKRRGTFSIEADASSASYFAAVPIIPFLRKPSTDVQGSMPFEQVLNDVIIQNPPGPLFQVDEKFQMYFRELGGASISRRTDLGDSIMTAIVLSPAVLAPNEVAQFTDLGRLRLQETDRILALRTELERCHADIREKGDTLTVYPSELHGAEIETYNDHRMAMCFAILGLKVPEIKIKNPACVKKTFPNFFQKLAAEPPKGLGATILDAKTGRKLTHEELFAD